MDVRRRPRSRLAGTPGRGGIHARTDPVAPPTIAAIDRAIEEIGLVRDAHRAIDWLSTFPQVVLVALGEGL